MTQKAKNWIIALTILSLPFLLFLGFWLFLD